MRVRDGSVLNPQSIFVWNEIWNYDAYGQHKQRRRRASHRAAAFQIIEHLQRNDSVLDVACGSGDFLSVLSELKVGGDGVLIGIDRSPIAVRLASKNDYKANSHLICGDATMLPLATSSVDNAFLFGIIEHIVDTDKILSEAKRVLKPRGRIFISTSNAMSALQIKNELLSYFGRYQYGYQKNWLRSAFLRKLREYFSIDEDFIMHADGDMPMVRLIDRIAGYTNRSWGRYICVRASKDG